MEDNVYSPEFYSRIAEWSLNSAKIVVPLVNDLLKPTSIIDIGCGDGTWLHEFQIAGVNNILGLDGNYVPRQQLKIDSQNFISCDLLNPPKLGLNFDLAVSLEVAEHLPFDFSNSFIDYLTSLSDMVLFSAGVPYQPGVHHTNTQWQGFWADLFLKNGYKPITTLRSKIWDQQSISFFYKQNLILFVNDRAIIRNYSLQEEINLSKTSPINVIHPDYYLMIVNSLNKKRKELTFSESLRFHLNRRIRYIRSKLRKE